MKVLLYLIFFFAFLVSKAQSYIPFPEKDASWNFTHTYMQPQMGKGGTCYEVHIQLRGDTIINGLKYIKVDDSLTSTATLSTSSCVPGYPINVYRSRFGYLRNDSANKKVFFRRHLTNQDLLIYDFSANVGDTVSSYTRFYSSSNFISQQYIIDSIANLHIAGKQRKVYYLRRQDSIYIPLQFQIIEGIGSTSGFLSRLDHFHNIYSQFHCFEEIGVGSYSPNGPCSITTSLEENTDANSPELYPNPSNDQVTLQIEVHIESILVFDQTGREVQNLRPNQQKFQWQLPERKGLYLIRWQDVEGNVGTKKVIKQ